MPAVAALIAVPFPLRMPVIDVDNVKAGVAPPLEVPASPLALATLTAVTAAPPEIVVHVGVPLPADVSTCPLVPAAV